MSGDKVKFLSKDLQEAKQNHFQLRDEISREFRKTYKKIGTLDKEVDLIKYRQTMASKKVALISRLFGNREPFCSVFTVYSSGYRKR